MKYKYQVVVHAPYYPTSALFETLEEADHYYQSAKGCFGDDELVTLCEIKNWKGENDYDDIIEWGI